MKRKAFTLVELLVVISIIALLVSILMPSLSKAREMAKFVVCSTNFHQMGLAFLQYAADNNDRIVAGNTPNGVTIQAYTPPMALGPGLLLSGGFIALPESESHIFYCPADKFPLYHEYQLFPGWQPRWFEDRWDVISAGANIIDISLEFRDSMDGNWSANWPPPDEMGRYKGAPTSQIGKHAIISDWFAHNRTAVQHKRKYNVLMGDSSVQVIDDRAFPEGLTGEDPKEIGLTNWAVYKAYAMGVNDMGDSIAYDAIDYIFGNPMWQIPDINDTATAGLGDPPVPYWRQ